MNLTKMLNVIFFSISLFGLYGCGDDTDNGANKICDPGVTQTCVCSGNGAKGVQSCNSNGTGWMNCVGCGGQADGDINTGKDGGVPKPDKKVTNKCDQDCSKLSFGGESYTCQPCNSSHLCLPKKSQFSGELKYINGTKYNWRTPDCSGMSSPIYSVSAKYYTIPNIKMFYHSVKHQNFTLVISIRDVSMNFTDTLFSGISSDPAKWHKVEVRMGGCVNHILKQPTNKPGDLGSVTLILSGASIGSTYDLKIDGFLNCNGTWKKFSYTANGYILATK